MTGRERSVFACLTDVVVAPGSGLPAVRDTDTVAGFEGQLAAAPAEVRLALRGMLVLVELLPRVLGFGGRLRQLAPADRTRALARMERHPLGASAVKVLRGVAHLSYYGDPRVMRRLGYDPAAVVARGAALRAAEGRW